ncbi:hypothetical protein ACIKT0_06220 [Hansschlegelia beijingensis]|uniref:hypothetical protein n=1 Tax=Hansschlegelia beijingensis TaxID=1133344 RepID=UPI00387EE96E
MTKVQALLECHLRSPETHWHIGTSASSPSSCATPTSRSRFPDDGGLAAFTARGAIRLEATKDITLFGRIRPGRWSAP